MKKLIAVLLALLLLFGVLPVYGAAGEPDRMTFAVASDIHYKPMRETLIKTVEDELFWHTNRRAAMDDESGWILDEFLEQCARNDEIEFVLISGDLADDGRTKPEDHRAVAKKLKEFEQKTGKSVFVINGNHDAADHSNTTYQIFKEIYAEFGYDQALSVREEDCSYVADLGEKYRLIALDSNNPKESTEDGMTLSKLLWVKQQAQQAKKDGRYPVLMMHHNLLEHMPLQRLINHDFIVRFHNTTAGLFADWGIKTVFSGHEHCSDAACYTSDSGNVIYDFATTALSMYPLQYRVFTFTDELISYRAETVDRINTDSLSGLQPMYTKTQLNAMNSGLNAYAKGFLKKGVEYRLALSLTMEKMGIAENSVFYPLVSTAVGGLTRLLEQPLYGENGVQSLALQYGLQIPDTKYENGWDLATSLVAMHYEGEESLTLDSVEVTTLLRMLALILRTDLPRVNDEVFMSAATEFLTANGMEPFSEGLTKLCCKIFGGVKPGEYFIAALISPFLYEFAFDDDGVNDNAGQFPGYGSENTNPARAQNVLNKLFNTVKTVFLYIKLFAHQISKAFGGLDH